MALPKTLDVAGTVVLKAISSLKWRCQSSGLVIVTNSAAVMILLPRSVIIAEIWLKLNSR